MGSCTGALSLLPLTLDSERPHPSLGNVSAAHGAQSTFLGWWPQVLLSFSSTIHSSLRPNMTIQRGPGSVLKSTTWTWAPGLYADGQSKGTQAENPASRSSRVHGRQDPGVGQDTVGS